MAIKGPVIGVPKGTVSKSRVDFNFSELTATIESHGSRLAWERASECPCTAKSGTGQPDLNCALCDQRGWFYFGPKDYVTPDEVGDLDDIQTQIVAAHKGVVIRGIMMSVNANAKSFDENGKWMWGSSMVTVRPENRLGYYDRITNIDAEIPYSEVVKSKGPSTILPLRYPATQISVVQSETTRYEEDADFILVKGVIHWLNSRGPALDTRLSMHYNFHPSWIVLEHPKVFREAQRFLKLKRAPKTPEGDPTALPHQSLVRLDYLVYASEEASS